MNDSELDQNETEKFDRRQALKLTGGVAAGLGLLSTVGGLQRALAAPGSSDGSEEVSSNVPSNFRTVIHATREDDWPYVFSSINTITKNYKKATTQLVADGSSVKALAADKDVQAQLKEAHDAGVGIYAASDALAINNIDPSSLPDYVNTDSEGVIAIVEAQVKGYHYVKP